MQRYYGDLSMIVSPDKDLRQVPGHHFDNHYTKNNYIYVDQDQATLNLYEQVLKGDMTDNIPGISGVGKQTVINLIRNFKEYCDIYKNTYKLENKLSIRDICCIFYGTMYPAKNPKDIKASIEALTHFHETYDLVYLHDVPLNENILKLNILNDSFIYEQ
jgi:5'-3' exonuclease